MKIPKFQIADVVNVNRNHDVSSNNTLWEYIFLRGLPRDTIIKIKEIISTQDGFYYKLEFCPESIRKNNTSFVGQNNDFPEDVLRLDKAYARNKKITQILFESI